MSYVLFISSDVTSFQVMTFAEEERKKARDDNILFFVY
jgi:hypothetical protein